MKVSKNSTPVRGIARRSPSPKLRVYSNLAISLDGKIATANREFFTLGSARDLRLLRKLRDPANAIIFGAGVLRAFRKPCLPLSPKRRLVNAVISRRLDEVDPLWPFFLDTRIDRILYVTHPITKRMRARFGKHSELVKVSGKNAARDVLKDLEKRGFTRVGVEGGGDIMWPFVAADLIDEYYVTLAPKIVGGRDAPSLVDGAGFDPHGVMNLKLKSLRRFGSEIFLVYTRRN